MSDVNWRWPQEWSSVVKSIWTGYADYIQSVYGIPRDTLLAVGAGGREILDLEFSLHGESSYRTSVVLPIRNLFYSACAMDNRGDVLDGMQLKEPILDYGCGVGFSLVYLKEMGYSNVYGYDLPGFQSDLARAYLKTKGVGWGIPDKPGTVMCINVLEHVAAPMTMLMNLRNFGGNLMANCDDDSDVAVDVLGPGPGHVASQDERRQVIASLRQHGQWCDFTGERILAWAS